VVVLEGLDLVPWAELETAGTSDEEIPELLRTIATPSDDKVALEALRTKETGRGHSSCSPGPDPPQRPSWRC